MTELNHRLLQERKIILFGASSKGKYIKGLLEYAGLNISYFCDNNADKQGELFEGIEIISSQKLAQIYISEGQKVNIIITSMYIEEIKNQLFDMNVHNNIYTEDDLYPLYMPAYIEQIQETYNINWDKSLSLWGDGIVNELIFWNEKILQYSKLENGTLLWNNNEYAEFIYEDILDANDTSKITILDVGSGPRSKYGTKIKGEFVNFMHIDPLAFFYNELIKKHGLDAVNPTIYGVAEYLSFFIPENTADIIVIDNALDHSFDPVKGIGEALKVLKVNGMLTMIHNSNEGFRNGYSGFHQWNIDIHNNQVVIWNEENKININELLKDYADIIVNEIWDARKCKSIEIKIIKRKVFEIKQLFNQEDISYLIEHLQLLMKKISEFQFVNQMKQLLE